MWYKTLGYSRYPLDPRSNTELVGVEDIQRKLVEYIEQGNMCLLCGFTGSGKTSMLKRVKKLKPLKKYTFIYLSADNLDKNFTVNDVIKHNTSFIKRVLSGKPKNLVILLDECHMANRILTESIKGKWNVEYKDGTKAIQSVIVSQIEQRLGTNFSGSFQDRLGSRVLVMPKLERDDLVGVLRKRLSSAKKNVVDQFDDDALTLLVESADGSVRQLLEYTDVILTKLENMEGENPLLDEDFMLSKEAVFNILQEANLISHDRLAKKESFQKIFADERLRQAADLFYRFGALSSVNLAEKLDQEHKLAEEVLSDLKEHDAIMFAHTDDGRDFFVLTPRMQHEMTRA